MPATLSIRGLYQADETLFSEMSVCSEMTNDDKQTIIDNILMEYAELEVLYPDPVFMKHAIGAWSWKEVPTWDRIYAAAMAEYNPIENYNRTETSSESAHGTHSENSSGSETHSGTDTETNSGTDNITHSGTDSSNTSNTSRHTGTIQDANSGSDTLTTNRAAFDSSSLVTTGTDTTQHGQLLTKTFNETTSDSGNASVTHGEKIGTTHGHVIATKHGESINNSGNRSGTDNNTITRNSHIAGNIGVTTSQQMLEQELLVAPKLNVYNYIMESFKNRFCLEVWS